jgi:hypothetical protein
MAHLVGTDRSQTNLLAERRLSDVLAFGNASKMQFLGKSDEVANMM